MLTNKAKYGLKAMIHLAGLPRGQSAFVQDIAERNGIPKKFLDTILGELRNAGYLSSKKGKSGGYTLAKAPEDILVGDIIRVIDGPLAPIACASRRSYVPCDDCRDVATCQVRLLMLEVRDAMAKVLDHRTLEELRAMAEGPMGAFVYHI